MLDEKDKINERGQQSGICHGEEGGTGQSGFDDAETSKGNREESRRGQVGQIYFIETEDGKYVKIGYSVQPIVRMSQLGTLRPGVFRLRLLGFMPGSRGTELWMHEKFISDRDSGEWFRDSPTLRHFIETLGLVQPVIRKPNLRRGRRLRTPIIEDDVTPIPYGVTGPVEPVIDAVPVTEYLAEIGRRGGQAKVPKGTAALTAAQRKALGKKAAAARWAKKR